MADAQKPCVTQNGGYSTEWIISRGWQISARQPAGSPSQPQPPSVGWHHRRRCRKDHPEGPRVDKAKSMKEDP